MLKKHQKNHIKQNLNINLCVSYAAIYKLFLLLKKVCCLRDTASCYFLIVEIGSRPFDVGFLLRNVLSACHCDVAMLCWFIYDIQVVVEKMYTGCEM